MFPADPGVIFVEIKDLKKLFIYSKIELRKEMYCDIVLKISITEKIA